LDTKHRNKQQYVKKKETNKLTHKDKLNENKEKYNNYTELYIDGSQSDIRVGLAVITETIAIIIIIIKMNYHCSIYTTKITAILKAIKYISN